MITLLAFSGIVCLWWKLLCLGWKSTAGVLRIFLAVVLAQAMIICAIYVGLMATLLISVDKWLFDLIAGLWA